MLCSINFLRVGDEDIMYREFVFSNIIDVNQGGFAYIRNKCVTKITESYDPARVGNI